MSEEIKETDYEVPVYSKRGMTAVSGKGAVLFDENGREYIDCIGGIGACIAGHCNENISDAVSEQLKKLICCSPLIPNQKRGELMKKLVDLTGLKQVFLCNSGTEAVEAAIKFARISTGKTDIISAINAFHGRSFGALSATHKLRYQDLFKPLVPGFKKFPFNNFEKLKEVVADGKNVAAIILELIQGEGGINIADKDFIKNVRALCDEKNILLILDEIQTGMCRTGTMFAYEQYGIKPDILCLAKALGGGFPIGAVVCNDKITIGKALHGSTFGGNPLACAASLATIKYMEEGHIADVVKEKGDYFIGKLREIKNKKIRDVRGRGLMIAVELKERVNSYIDLFTKKGVLVLICGRTVIRFLPPASITKKQIDRVVKVVKEILEAPEKEDKQQN